MQQQMDADKMKKQRERLMQRLVMLNMAEKSVIPAYVEPICSPLAC